MTEEIPSQAAGLDECLALVDRIVSSRQISRAARLRAFLVYVADRTLRHGATNLREQEIGEAVFNRDHAYDTSLDNIVRVNATELRKRLEQYFQEEGSREELVLTIPRGSYVPSFSRRYSPSRIFDTASDLEVEPPVEEGLVSVEPAQPILATVLTPPMRSLAVWAISGTLLVATLLLVFLLVRQHRQFVELMQPWGSDPALSRMWSSMLASKDELDLVTADTSLALVKDISGRSISLNDYIHFHYGNIGPGSQFGADRQADLEQVLDRNTVSLGDVHVAQQIFKLSPYRDATRLISAREFNTEAVRQNNVVLIGSRQSNPWVELFEDQVNFSLEYDISRHQAYVLNRTPKGGEQPRYETAEGTSHTGGYAVIALVAGLLPGKRVLMLSGTDAQATQAAGEFVTSPGSLREIFSHMPDGKLLPFEVLLRISQLTGTPLRSEVVAVRVAGH